MCPPGFLTHAVLAKENIYNREQPVIQSKMNVPGIKSTMKMHSPLNQIKRQKGIWTCMSERVHRAAQLRHDTSVENYSLQNVRTTLGVLSIITRTLFNFTQLCLIGRAAT